MNLDRIAFIGRTFSEYRDLFGLDESILADGPVLDCAAGPSSFRAEGAAMGFDITAADTLYGRSVDELRRRSEEDLKDIFGREFQKVSHRYIWDYYKSQERVVSLRREALDLFCHDYESGLSKGSYVSATLPGLPFADGSFSLVLSSHFLFLYRDSIDIDQHLQCLREMLRVSSREVRVFPLMTLGGREYEHIDRVLSTFANDGIYVTIEPVRLEFLKGANKVLRLSKKS